MRVWSTDSLKATFALVASSGRAIVPCTSPREAKLFRQALYGFRRRNPTLPIISARVDGHNVIVTNHILREVRPSCQS